MVCLPLAGLNHGAASDRWPTWGQASLPRSGFVQVPSFAHYSLVQNLSDADKSNPTGKISTAGPEFREGRSTGEERRAGYGAPR